jgi:hypothetical protein
MENIKFFLKENEEVTTENISIENAYVNDISYFINDSAQLELHYRTNYNVKSLNQILQYYGINKSKMVKDEMVQVLVFFETDSVNADIVFRRMRLWQNIQELKADSYFSKYIMF